VLVAVARAEVRLEEGRATVHWNPRAEPDVERVVSAIKLAGYDAAPVATVSCRHVHASESVTDGRMEIYRVGRRGAYVAAHHW